MRYGVSGGFWGMRSSILDIDAIFKMDYCMLKLSATSMASIPTC